MFQGRFVAIHIAKAEGEDLFAVEEARLEPGRGIEGDRYRKRAGERGLDDPNQELTLIESEALAAIRHEDGLQISGAESRRNLLTEGVPLNHLVERRFRIGGTELEGCELCEPCGVLEKVTVKGAVKALLHRAGLRARIVRGGVIRPGNPIEPA